jgi:tetratricopeptide (TPR) repeat protein
MKFFTMPSRGTLLVLAAAITARAIYFFQYCNSPFFEYYRNDQLAYREWGLRIAAGDWLGDKPFDRQPLYAYLLGVAYRLFGPHDWPVLSLQLLGGVATVALLLWVARRIWGTQAGVAAGCLAALYGPLIFYECAIMKTFLEPLFVTAALAAGLHGGERGRTRWFAAAGGAVGFACLVREVHGVLLLPLLAAAMVPWVRPEPPLSRRLLSGGAVLLGFAVVLAPSALHNRAFANASMVVSATVSGNLWVAFGPLATGYQVTLPYIRTTAFDEIADGREETMLRAGRRLNSGEVSRYWFDATVRWVRDAPWRTIRLMGTKAAILFNDHEIPDNEDFAATGASVPLLAFLPTFGWIAGLGLLGFGRALRRRDGALLTAAFAAALILEILLTYNNGRYRAGLAAVWLLLAGGGAALLASGDFWRRTPGFWTRLALAAGAIVLTALAFRPLPGIDPRYLDRVHDLFKSQAVENDVMRRRIPALHQAIAAQPQDLKLREQLGLTLVGAGRISEAIRVYEEILRIDPGLLRARSRLAAILARIGDLEGASREARALVSLQPGLAGSWLLLGQIVFRQAGDAADDLVFQRRLDEAKLCFEKALGIDPDNAEAHYELGKLLHLGGGREAALREVESALRLAPDDKRAAHLERLIRASERPEPRE